jgi:hypothetical protein
MPTPPEHYKSFMPTSNNDVSLLEINPQLLIIASNSFELGEHRQQSPHRKFVEGDHK